MPIVVVSLGHFPTYSQQHELYQLMPMIINNIPTVHSATNYLHAKVRNKPASLPLYFIAPPTLILLLS